MARKMKPRFEAFWRSLTPHVSSGRLPDIGKYEGHSVNEETLIKEGRYLVLLINARKYHILAGIRLFSQSADLLRRAS